MRVVAPHYVALLIVAGCTSTSAPPDVEYLTSPQLESLNVPFSEAVRVDDMLYLSGQLGNVPGTRNLVEGGIRAETLQTLENIEAVLARHGSSIRNIVKCTIYMTDIGEWPAMNEVYAEFFGERRPARSALAGSGLALGARVEIECMATIG